MPSGMLQKAVHALGPAVVADSGAEVVSVVPSSRASGACAGNPDARTLARHLTAAEHGTAYRATHFRNLSLAELWKHVI